MVSAGSRPAGKASSVKSIIWVLKDFARDSVSAMPVERDTSLSEPVPPANTVMLASFFIGFFVQDKYSFHDFPMRVTSGSRRCPLLS